MSDGQFDGPRQREIYVIRHGATKLNGESGGVDRIRGWKNVPLSNEGKREVKELGQKLRDSGIKFLVHSTLDRAADTAEAVAATTKAELIPSSKFKPWDLGEFSGEVSSVVHPKIVNYATKWPERRIPGGESFEEFKHRVFGGLREYMLKDFGDVMGIVTHHRVERLIKAWIAAGSRSNKALDINVMFQFGESTAHAERVKIQLASLYGY